MIVIRQYSEKDREQIIELWKTCDLTRPWNDPNKDFDEEVWKRISYEQLEIKFGKISPYRYVQLIDKKDKFNVRIQLTAFFNKQARQIGNYIKDELKHLVTK